MGHLKLYAMILRISDVVEVNYLSSSDFISFTIITNGNYLFMKKGKTENAFLNTSIYTFF